MKALGVQPEAIAILQQFMRTENVEQLLEYFPGLQNDDGYRQLAYLLTTLQQFGYGAWAAFNPAIIRGFDYYDGMVFEVFDRHPDNLRALFGGGRYNGLAGIFGEDAIPAVGFAPGDETTRLFLASWDLIPESLLTSRVIYIPMLDERWLADVTALAKELRQAGQAVEQGLELRNIKQALKYANRKQFPFVLLIGEDEARDDTVSLKNMRTGEQHQYPRTDLLQALHSHTMPEMACMEHNNVSYENTLESAGKPFI